MIDKILKHADLKSAPELIKAFSELSSTATLDLSAHERRLLESYVILHELASGLPPEPQMLHPRLTIVANDLTDLGELARLEACANAIQKTRRQDMEKQKRRGFLPSLYVLGYGANYSGRYPYRSPEAEEIRDRLQRQGVIFWERPLGASPEDLRALIERLLK
ncbi:MAG TPA: hypothetical protein VGG72_02335 [Bryobacteraceae bacterium]|jgi:hypothetical protein